MIQSEGERIERKYLEAAETIAITTAEVKIETASSSSSFSNNNDNDQK